MFKKIALLALLLGTSIQAKAFVFLVPPAAALAEAIITGGVVASHPSNNSYQALTFGEVAPEKMRAIILDIKASYRSYWAPMGDVMALNADLRWFPGDQTKQEEILIKKYKFNPKVFQYLDKVVLPALSKHLGVESMESVYGPTLFPNSSEINWARYHALSLDAEHIYYNMWYLGLQ